MVWDYDNFMSPEPNIINFGFITDFLVDLKNNFMHFMMEFHHNEKLSRGINNTFIALIPKVKSSQRLADFRLISMVGSMYKFYLRSYLTN